MDQPTVIITGASRGIGAAAAAAAVQRGARVVLTARNRAALDQTAQQIRQNGGSVAVVDGDIADPAVCQEVVAQAVKTFGRVDALINNAGVIGPLSVLTNTTPDEWVRTLQTNLFGPVLLCREAVPYLRQTRGKIVNISSGAAVWPIPGGSAYSTSKAAINHFSKILSLEEPSITVIAFNPGDVDTPMQAEIREKGRVEGFEGIHDFLVGLYEQGQLLPPEQAALSAVALALAAPLEWSGEFLQQDEERVQELTGHFAASWRL